MTDKPETLHTQIGCGCLVAVLLGSAFLLICMVLGLSDIALAILHLAHRR